jgi:hypothetical protein
LYFSTHDTDLPTGDFKSGFSFSGAHPAGNRFGRKRIRERIHPIQAHPESCMTIIKKRIAVADWCGALKCLADETLRRVQNPGSSIGYFRDDIKAVGPSMTSRPDPARNRFRDVTAFSSLPPKGVKQGKDWICFAHKMV